MATSSPTTLAPVNVVGGQPSRPKAYPADQLAGLAGGVVMAFGIGQLFLPNILQPFTGLEAGNAATIVGGIWTIFGGMMAIGGATRLRAVTINAAISLLVVTVCGASVMLWESAGTVPIVVHGAMAAFALTGSALLYLVDRSDLKRQLLEFRATSNDARSSVEC